MLSEEKGDVFFTQNPSYKNLTSYPPLLHPLVFFPPSSYIKQMPGGPVLAREGGVGANAPKNKFAGIAMVCLFLPFP